jgi:hypothetical protein
VGSTSLQSQHASEAISGMKVIRIGRRPSRHETHHVAASRSKYLVMNPTFPDRLLGRKRSLVLVNLT